MSGTLAKLSRTVLCSVRQTTHLPAARSCGIVASHIVIGANGNAGGENFGHFSTSIDASDRIPTEAEVNAALKDWESTVGSLETAQLTPTEKRIHSAHVQAVKDRQEMYSDPTTGYQVYTTYGHIARGSCCGNACRHCPFDHHNVSLRYKSIKKNNGAFYC